MVEHGGFTLECRVLVGLLVGSVLGLPSNTQAQGVPGHFSGRVTALAPTGPVREEDPPPVSYDVTLADGNLGTYQGDYTRTVPVGAESVSSTLAFRVEAFGGTRPLVSVEVAAHQDGPRNELIGADQAAGSVELLYEIGLEQLRPPPIPFQNFITPPLEFFVDAAAEVSYSGASTPAPGSITATVNVWNPHVDRRFDQRIDVSLPLSQGPGQLSESRRWAGLRMFPGDVVRAYLRASAQTRTNAATPTNAAVRDSEALAVADPSLEFNQPAFDAAMAAAGFPSYTMSEYFRVVVSPGLAEAVPVLFRDGFED